MGLGSVQAFKTPSRSSCALPISSSSSSPRTRRTSCRHARILIECFPGPVVACGDSLCDTHVYVCARHEGVCVCVCVCCGCLLASAHLLPCMATIAGSTTDSSSVSGLQAATAVQVGPRCWGGGCGTCCWGGGCGTCKASCSRGSAPPVLLLLVFMFMCVGEPRVCSWGGWVRTCGDSWQPTIQGGPLTVAAAAAGDCLLCYQQAQGL